MRSIAFLSSCLHVFQLLSRVFACTIRWKLHSFFLNFTSPRWRSAAIRIQLYFFWHALWTGTAVKIVSKCLFDLSFCLALDFKEFLSFFLSLLSLHFTQTDVTYETFIHHRRKRMLRHDYFWWKIFKSQKWTVGIKTQLTDKLK